MESLANKKENIFKNKENQSNYYLNLKFHNEGKAQLMIILNKLLNENNISIKDFFEKLQGDSDNDYELEERLDEIDVINEKLNENSENQKYSEFDLNFKYNKDLKRFLENYHLNKIESIENYSKKQKDFDNILYEKIEILSDIANLVYKNYIKDSSGDIKVEDFSYFIRKNIGLEAYKKFNNYLKSPLHSIYVPNYKENSTTVEYDYIYKGVSKYLTIKELYEILPEYFIVTPDETYVNPINLTSDTQGAKLYNIFNAAFRNPTETIGMKSMNNKNVSVVNASIINDSESLTIGEIENILEETVNKANTNIKKEYKELSDSLLDIIKTKQNFFNLGKISSLSNELSSMEKKFMNNIKNNLTNFINQIINEGLSKKINIEEVLDIELNKNINGIGVIINVLKLEDFNVMMNEYNLTKAEKTKFLNILNDFNKEIKKEIIEVNDNLRNLDIITNIEMTKRRGEKILNNFSFDPKILKEFVYISGGNEKPLHLYSEPGVGKTTTAENFYNLMGVPFNLVVPGDEPDVIINKLASDNDPSLHKGTSIVNKSLFTMAKESGEKRSVIFVDEFIRLVIHAVRTGRPEVFNNILEAGNDKDKQKVKMLFASNGTLDSDEIAASLRSRIKEVNISSVNFENPQFIESSLYKLHDTNLYNLYDFLNNENLTELMNIINDNKKSIYKHVEDLEKNNKEVFKVLRKINENNLYPNTKELEKISKEIIDINLFETEDIQKIIENFSDIFSYFNLEKIYKEENKKAKELNILLEGVTEPEKILEIKRDINTKYDVEKIEKFLGVKLTDEDKSHMKNLNSYINRVYQIAKVNPAIQYNKLFTDFGKETEETSKSKIKLLLKEVINQQDINKLEILNRSLNSKNNFERKIENTNIEETEKEYIKQLLKTAKDDVIEVLAKLNVKNPFLLLPLHNNKISILNKIIISPSSLELKDRKLNGVKYKSFDIHNFGNDEIKINKDLDDWDDELEENEDDNTLIYKGENKVTGFNNLLFIESQIIAALNKYIREDIQELDHTGKPMDLDSFDVDKISVNKITYRTLNDIVNSIYKQMNSEEGVNISEPFKKIISNVLPNVDDKSEFLETFEKILSNVKSLHEGRLNDSGSYIVTNDYHNMEI